MKKQDYQRTVLKSGLRVVTVPMKSTQTVAVHVFVGAGSRQETKDINGIAHFLEHMFFKGGKKYPDTKAVAGTLDGVGAQYNAGTGEETVDYFVKLPLDKVELAFDVLSDMLLSAKLDQVEIDSERRVIMEEFNRVEDTPNWNIFDLFQGLMYGDQPLGRRVIGERSVLKHLNRADFVNYRSRLYVPSNLVVAVAGNITHTKVLQLVNKYFSLDTDTTKVKTLAAKSPTSNHRVLLHNQKTKQTHFVLGIPSVSGNSEDRYTSYLLATILGGSMSSRLWLKLRERHGLCYSVHTDVNVFTDTGYIATYAGVDVKRVDLAIKLILEEYQLMTKELVSPAELRKNKDMVRGKMIMAMENSNYWANVVGSRELLYGKILTPEEELAKLDAVTAKDVQKLAAKLFKKDKMHLAVIGPYKDKTVFTKLLK